MLRFQLRDITGREVLAIMRASAHGERKGNGLLHDTVIDSPSLGIAVPCSVDIES